MVGCMESTILKIENISKSYKLGQIGGTTLKEELQRIHARVRHKEDPTRMIGSAEITPGTEFQALDDVSFQVRYGERIGIIGHNGAGKSTLLKLISRVTAPTKGDIWINGRVASMLEVGTGFHGELTGRENIYMNGAILGMRKKEIDQKIESIIEFSECRQFIDTPVKRYSSGMYVKLAFSVAAHLDSEIMIMDEVLAVGDMAFQNKCLDKMREVSNDEGRTILYVSHNMNTIRQLCDRVIVLSHGKVVFDGDVESGIKKYMGIMEKGLMPSQYELKNVKRLFEFGKSALITSLSFVGKIEPSYSSDEKAVIRITFHSDSDVENARTMFIIKNSYYQKIGMMFSETFLITKGKDNVVFLEADFKNLSEGKYCLDVALIYIYDNLDFYTLDDAGEKILFKINNNAPKGINWHKEYWGDVQFPEMKILDRGYESDEYRNSDVS